jgi:deazaflavin-dependent oxidoreductase (nitroreductase family)
MAVDLALRVLRISGRIVANGGVGAAVLARFFQGHVRVYRLTRGLIGHRFPGMPPFLVLEHRGAKSGAVRRSPLGYFRDGSNVILVASNGGGPKNPAWLYNLRANPDVNIWIGSEKRSMRAHVAGPEERARLWPKALEASEVFVDYQERTERAIPLMVLEPTS